MRSGVSFVSSEAVLCPAFVIAIICSTVLYQTIFYETPLVVLYLDTLLKPLRPRDAYMRHHTGSSLDHMMACRLFAAKPLSQPILHYSQLDNCQHLSEIWLKILWFTLKKMNVKILSAKWQPSCLCLNVLNTLRQYIGDKSITCCI